MIAARAGRRRPFGGGQGNGIANVGVDRHLHHAIRNRKGDRRRSFRRKENRYGAVLPHGGNPESVPVLFNGRRPLRLHCAAGHIVTGVRCRRNGHAAAGNRAALQIRALYRQLIPMQQRPGGRDRLIPVHLPMAGIGVLFGYDNGERRLHLQRGLQAVRRPAGAPVICRADFRRIVPQAIARLHIGNRLAHGFPVKQALKKRALIAIVSAKRDGLAVTINDAQPAIHQRLFQTVGCHAKANRHPYKAIAAVSLHMIGNRGAIHLIVLHPAAGAAVDRVVIRVVPGRQPLPALQTQIRGRCTRRIVLVRPGIIRIAVAVKDDDAAAFHGVRNRINGRGLSLEKVVCTLGRRGNAVRLRLILLRKRAVQPIVRLEQIHVPPVLAALFRMGNRLEVRRIFRLFGFLRRGHDLLQTRRIRTRDAALRLPDDTAVTAQMNGVRHNAIRGRNKIADRLRDAVVRRVSLRKPVRKGIYRIQNQIGAFIIRRVGNLSVRLAIRAKGRYAERKQHGQRQGNGKQPPPSLFHIM